MRPAGKISFRHLQKAKAYLPVIFIGIASGIVSAIPAISACKDDGVLCTAGLTLVSLGVIALCSLLQIVIHESGHMAAGAACGWKFVSFMIAGVLISRTDGHLKISRAPIRGAGGQCLMMPPEGKVSNKGIILYNAGGVAANALTGILATAAATALYGKVGYWPMALMCGIGFSGILLALTNAIPSDNTPLPNDGTNIRILIREGECRRIFIDILKANALQHMGQRLKDMPEELFKIPHAADASNHFHLMAMSIAVERELDRADFASAAAIARDALRKRHGMIRLLRDELECSELFCALMLPHQDSLIERMLTGHICKIIESADKGDISILRLRYALALIYDKDHLKAEELYCAAQQMMKSYHNTGELQSERELFEIVRTKGMMCKTDTNNDTENDGTH